MAFKFDQEFQIFRTKRRIFFCKIEIFAVLTQIFSNDIIVELYLQITLLMMKNDASIPSDAVFGREIRMQIIKEIIQYLALDRKQNVYK